MIFWRNRAIDTLSPPELRQAIVDALAEVARLSHQPPSAHDRCAAGLTQLIASFAAGAVIAVFAIVVGRALA